MFILGGVESLLVSSLASKGEMGPMDTQCVPWLILVLKKRLFACRRNKENEIANYEKKDRKLNQETRKLKAELHVSFKEDIESRAASASGAACLESHCCCRNNHQ